MSERQLTAYDVTEAKDRADDVAAKYLREAGWKHTSSTPGCYWLWTRTLDDGRVLLVQQPLAVSMTPWIVAEPEEPDPC